MKKIVIILMCLMTIPFYAQWIEQVSGVEKVLNDVFCVTQDIVFVVGVDGTILKTIDGGQNWTQKNSGTSMDLMKVEFVNPNTGFAFGENGTLLKTVDGGENWNAINIGETTNFYQCDGLSCINENVFYISCPLWIKRTQNGGLTFETLNTPLSQSIYSIQFLNEQVGYASISSYLYKTIDGGNSWTEILTQHGKFFFLNENIGFTYQNGNLIKTINGGTSFSIVGYPNDMNLEAVDLSSVNENILWQIDGSFPLCGCPPAYCITKKSLTESPENQEINNCNLGEGLDLRLNSISFANDTNGYAVGFLSYTGDMGPHIFKGAIFKNTSGTMLHTNNANQREDFLVFPNPTSDKINLSIPEKYSKTFQIDIANCLGNIVYSKVFNNSKIEEINVESLSKGVYFLKIINEEKINTQKIIIE